MLLPQRIPVPIRRKRGDACVNVPGGENGGGHVEHNRLICLDIRVIPGSRFLAARIAEVAALHLELPGHSEQGTLNGAAAGDFLLVAMGFLDMNQLKRLLVVLGLIVRHGAVAAVQGKPRLDFQLRILLRQKSQTLQHQTGMILGKEAKVGEFHGSFSIGERAATGHRSGVHRK